MYDPPYSMLPADYRTKSTVLKEKRVEMPDHPGGAPLGGTPTDPSILRAESSLVSAASNEMNVSL
jgi:hypothetical protein